MLAASSFVMGQQEDKKAIVLACFGTSYPSALVAITNIQKQVRNAFPGVKVQVAFTSNERAGIRVICDIHGLGENNEWAKIYVRHIEDVARDNHIEL